MTAQHTLGPWRVSKSKARRVTGEHGVVICNAVLRNQGGPKEKTHMKDEHEAEANAELIAAAPELLAALELARNTFAGIGMAKIASDICDAAIAKATGK